MKDRKAFYSARARARVGEVNRHYHQLLKAHYRFLVPPGHRVLELGCGLGDVLAAVSPSCGVGVDFSEEIISLARARHPHLNFQVASAETFRAEEPFDYIILSDLVNDLQDVQLVLENLQALSHRRTRLVMNFFSHLWHPILSAAEVLGQKAPTPPQNWLSTDDMINLLYLAGWEVIKVDPRILWPVRTPLLASFFNRWMAPLLPSLNLTVFLVSRQKPRLLEQKELTCSVVIPARNEEGNIEAAVRRTPEMGLGTELIFVEGHSRDNTWQEIQRVQKAYPNRKIKILQQSTSGKGGAVRDGFKVATGDLLFILDADLTMPPEQLPKFYEAAKSGAAEFVNGVRLVYPMENEAMRFLNMVANKFFGLAFSWLLGQSVKDTLCGTKVIFREDYEQVSANRRYFGDFDPFGDFDLLFGAAKLNLKILDLPIRYAARTYGETNIDRWRHGWLLLKMVVFAAAKLKFLGIKSVPRDAQSAELRPEVSVPEKSASH
jgi:SAM-dependent methyltransferase